MEGILVMGSPLAGLAGLPLALRRGCRSRWGEVGYRSSCVKNVMCALKDSIDSGFWRLVCTRFKTLLNAVESVRFLRGWCLQLDFFKSKYLLV